MITQMFVELLVDCIINIAVLYCTKVEDVHPAPVPAVLVGVLPHVQPVVITDKGKHTFYLSNYLSFYISNYLLNIYLSFYLSIYLLTFYLSILNIFQILFFFHYSIDMSLSII